MEKKIDVFIIGAQKAGTTSLKKYLAQHSEIVTHEHMEFAFFADNNEYRKGFPRVFVKYFKLNENDSRIILCKNATLYEKEDSLLRLFLHNPECKIIFILREPVARAYSAYLMGVNDGWITEPFQKYVSLLLNKKMSVNSDIYRYIFQLGLYSELLEQVYASFKKEQVFLVKYESLKDAPARVCSELFSFIGVGENFHPDFSKMYNVTRKVKSRTASSIIHFFKSKNSLVKRAIRFVLGPRFFARMGYVVNNANLKSVEYPPLSEDLFRSLAEFYKHDVIRLESLTKFDLSAWKK